jgi:hypothetical protein
MSDISQLVAQLWDRNVFTQSAAARDLRDLARDPSQRQRIAAAEGAMLDRIGGFVGQQ